MSPENTIGPVDPDARAALGLPEEVAEETAVKLKAKKKAKAKSKKAAGSK